MVLFARTLAFITAALWCLAATPGDCMDQPAIAPWYRNLGGAVSLRFDDGLESHITTAIPLLNRYDYNATFLVNPGTERYRARQDFWERQVPAMGHRLGNHTMNHRGARNIEDADYEIGEAARTIWRIYPKESKLLVFASGGGRILWGGKDWEQAAPAYRQLVQKYHLIDLYDGKHPYLSVRSGMRTEDLCAQLGTTLDRRGHQAYVFHAIGSSSLFESLKTLVRGYGLTIKEETLAGLLRCLDERKHQLWVAPLIDILKYEQEAQGATIRLVSSGRRSETLALAVRTDPELYDHLLTIVLPLRQGMAVVSVRQNDEPRQVYNDGSGDALADVRPVNSTIIVTYGAVRAGHKDRAATNSDERD